MTIQMTRDKEIIKQKRQYNDTNDDYTANSVKFPNCNKITEKHL